MGQPLASPLTLTQPRMRRIAGLCGYNCKNARKSALPLLTLNTHSAGSGALISVSCITRAPSVTVLTLLMGGRRIV